MRRISKLFILLSLVASVASANPCFKVPKGFQPRPPAGSAAVLVVTTPSPIVFSPVEQWRALSGDEVREVDDELSRLLVQGLQSRGIDARALSGGADALVYRSKGRICANRDEVGRITSQVSELLKSSSLDSALAVRLMVHRQQYHKIDMGRLVNRETAIVARDGAMPLLYTANGEVHLLGRDGTHLNYFFVLDSWGIKRSGKDELELLDRSGWLSELAAQILRTLDLSGGSAGGRLVPATPFAPACEVDPTLGTRR